MIKPPARSAFARSLSSAAAGTGAANEISANAPLANASMAAMRRESASMINLQSMRGCLYTLVDSRPPHPVGGGHRVTSVKGLGFHAGSALSLEQHFGRLRGRGCLRDHVQWPQAGPMGLGQHEPAGS